MRHSIEYMKYMDNGQPIHYNVEFFHIQWTELVLELKQHECTVYDVQGL